jgi:SsrA-binding protein
MKNNKVEIKNKRAYYNFEILEEIVAGISLIGSEVKSIRECKASIGESYCLIQDEEVFITGMHISEYKESGRDNHEPYRRRKLLLTKKQIRAWDKKLQTKGLTIVPLKLFIKNGLIKISIALCRGNKNYDKRQNIKAKDIQRDVDREIKG